MGRGARGGSRLHAGALWPGPALGGDARDIGGLRRDRSGVAPQSFHLGQHFYSIFCHGLWDGANLVILVVLF